MSDRGLSWEWLGHFSVRVRWEGGTLYVDPCGLRRKLVPADLVLITNPRLGHRSREDVERVARAGTVVAGPADAIAGLPGDHHPLAPGEGLTFAGAEVVAVPAYTRRVEFFPEARGWVGYQMTIGDRVLYHAGATERIPEMDGIRADTAFLPVSGRYVMGAEEARDAGEAMGARELVALQVIGDRYVALPGFVTRPSREAAS